MKTSGTLFKFKLGLLAALYQRRDQKNVKKCEYSGKI